MKTRQYDMPSVVLKSGFENCMVKDIKSDILSKMPHIDEDWLDFTAGISGLVYTAFEVFISEAKKGHIFCDDLFRSTLKKYCKTYIPTEWDSSALIKQYFDNNENFKDVSWNTIYSNSSNITYLLICYDFCCNFMTQFYPTIEQIYHVDLNVNGFTKKVMLSGYYDWSMLIMQEMKNNAKDIIQKMEHPINFPYIHTSNNLAEVLARLPKQPEPEKVPSRKASLPLDDDLRITVTGPAKGKKAEPKSAPTTIFDNPSSRPKGFAALAGMTELKEKFRSDIIDVIREPERARALNITLPNGALLYGPPGCGKTFFAEKLAEEAGCNFILVNCSDIASSFIHGTQKLIAEKFAEAEENKPSIIFFDEIDAMIPKRNARGSEYTKTEVNEFLTQLNHCGRKGIIAIGATNERVKEHIAKREALHARFAKAMNDNNLDELKQIILDEEIVCPISGTRNWTDVRQFNLMFQTEMGSTADGAMKIYLRPETAQGIFVNFLNVQKTGRMKVPFGIAQIGKAFRNEIVARQFVFRMREFEQMEMQFFVRPGSELKWFEHWKQFRLKWHKALGLGDEKYRFHDHDKLAHYANAATDIEFLMPFGFKEVEGIHSRTNFDLSQHAKYSGKKIEYFDPELNQSYTPYVIETSIGVDRMFLSVMCSSYEEQALEGGDTRVVLHLPAVLAPVKACIMPLVKKDGLPEKAREIMNELKFDFKVAYDEKDSIGKRYRRQDAVGTPFCITVDHDTEKDGCVTVRYRDTMTQDRVKIEDLHEIIRKATDPKELYRKIVGDSMEDTME